MEVTLIIIVAFIAAYLVGSLNFSIIFFKLADKADPRLSHSGNAGTANVYRQAGVMWAAVVFLLDIGRAVAVAAFSLHILPASYVPWTGLFLVLGNSFPCFHGFRGGKGVATYLGFSAFIAPWSAIFAAIVWLAVYGVHRITFVASFFMVFVLTVGLNASFDWKIRAVIGAAATFALIVFNHRKNIVESWKTK